ncbi:DNA polymerase epsilon subunit 4 isoform X2 [Phocoena sinus]|uniref:DNA polymerase epsilon subunit 4 n=2 Tax=Odontoceti TaxID=9722 RepID=A0A8C9CU52_PHOSS|nr:DNA polymerase epsilon subunit 4 isoform X2 [Phocoena sinus]
MAAVATGNGAFQEEEGTGGDAAAPQPHAPTSAPGARLSRLPLARVKALVKADPDVTLAGQEAIFILARAAELFVETIAKDAYCCAQQGKRKTLQRRDLDNAIEAVDEFAFLEGTRASHCCGLSHCGAQAPDAQAQWPWLTCLATPRHVGSSWTGARTCVPCVGRRTLNHCATREALSWYFGLIAEPGQFCEPVPASFS